MPTRRCSDLSERTRRLLMTAAIADGALRVAALIDIKRQPASQIRGRKRVLPADPEYWGVDTARGLIRSLRG